MFERLSILPLPDSVLSAGWFPNVIASPLLAFSMGGLGMTAQKNTEIAGVSTYSRKKISAPVAYRSRFSMDESCSQFGWSFHDS